MHPHIQSARNGSSALAKGAADNPREMLINLIDQHKDSTKEDLFKQFRGHLEDEPGYRRAVDWYFFINMYEYATTSRNRNKDPVQRAAHAAGQREAVDNIKAQVVLLALIMPNGKAMKDCSGAEMARFGNRYQKIAARVGKNKTVGAVLSEDQVKGILK